MSEISHEDMRKEAERELKMRKRVYPRWVEQHRMSQAEADSRIRVMEAIAAHFRPRDLFDSGPQ